jgi:hypothetical protein
MYFQIKSSKQVTTVIPGTREIFLYKHRDAISLDISSIKLLNRLNCVKVFPSARANISCTSPAIPLKQQLVGILKRARLAFVFFGTNPTPTGNSERELHWYGKVIKCSRYIHPRAL